MYLMNVQFGSFQKIRTAINSQGKHSSQDFKSGVVIIIIIIIIIIILFKYT